MRINATPLSFSFRTTLLEYSLGLGGALGAWAAQLQLWNVLVPDSWSSLRVQLIQSLELTCILIAVIWVIQKLPLKSIERITSLSQRLIFPLLKTTSFGSRASMCLSAGIGEEILFRGFIQTAILVYWPFGIDWGLNVLLGIGVSSLLFGMGHSITKTYAFIATLLGAVFGIVYYYSGTLLLVIVAHALYDLWAMEYLLHIQNRELAE